MPHSRRIDFALVQRLPDGTVIPASGRRPAHSPPTTPRRGDAARGLGSDRGRPVYRPTRTSDPLVMPSEDATPPAGPISTNTIHPKETPDFSTPVSNDNNRCGDATAPSTLGGLVVEQEIDCGRSLTQEATGGATTPPTLFTTVCAPLLHSPPPPQRAATNRRKTMAAMDITMGGGWIHLETVQHPNQEQRLRHTHCKDGGEAAMPSLGHRQRG